MILSVIGVCALSSAALDADSAVEEETAASVSTDEAAENNDQELAPSGADAELQETGLSVVPVNLGNNFYARVKMINHTDYYLTSPSKAAQTPQTKKATGYNNQVWHFTRKDNYYRIRSVSLNRYLEVKNADVKDGDPLYFAADRNAAEQKWIISKDSTGYRIHSFVDNAFVLLSVNPTASSSRVVLSSEVTNKDAYFSFEKLSIKSDKLASPVVKLSCHYQGVLAQWDAVTYAAKYRVHRYDDAKKQWVVLGDTTDTKFIDTKVASGNTYKYAVKVISPVLSDFVAKSILYIAAPVISVSNTNNGPVVSWKAVKGAAKVKVFIKNAGKWTTLATTTENSVTHKNFEYNKAYSYTARCVSADGKTYTSAYNTTGVTNTIVRTPEPKVRVMPFSLDVSWSASDGASKYRVFVKGKTTNNSWKVIANCVGTSYRYSDVVNGSGYYFCVRALDAKGKLISGNKSTVLTYFYDAPVVKSITAGDKYNKLSWYAVVGAYKYRVFAWNGKKWVTKGDSAAYGLTFNAPIAGSKEQNVCYAVRAMDKNGKFISYYLETVNDAGLKYYYPGQYTSTHKF